MPLKVDIQVDISRKLESVLNEIGKMPLDPATARTVGETVVGEMKTLVASGVSPIEGKGKFPAYKNPRKYPGTRKSKTPVNLKLSGDFLNGLKHSPVKGEHGYEASIYYRSDQEPKEKGHMEGANGQPKRPTLPVDKGQEFTARIRLLYTNLIRERIFRLLKGEG